MRAEVLAQAALEHCPSISTLRDQVIALHDIEDLEGGSTALFDQPGDGGVHAPARAIDS